MPEKRVIKKRSPASFDLETPFLTSTVTIATIKEQNNILLILLSNCLSAWLLHLVFSWTIWFGWTLSKHWTFPV